jgi:hypothetical protein
LFLATWWKKEGSLLSRNAFNSLIRGLSTLMHEDDWNVKDFPRNVIKLEKAEQSLPIIVRSFGPFFLFSLMTTLTQQRRMFMNTIYLTAEAYI